MSVSHPPVKLQKPRVRRTPTRDACMRLLPQAIANNWSSRELAEAANVDPATAANVLAEISEQIHADSKKAIGLETQKLAEDARKARNKALQRIEKLGNVVDNLTNALEASGQAAKAKVVGTAVKAAGDLWKHVEALTGVDVAKAIAVKQAAPKEGETSLLLTVSLL